MITNLTIDRIKEVSNAQVDLVPDSYWSRLGKKFLHIYYKEIINSRYSFGLVFLYQDRVAGYITATKDARMLMRDVIKNNALEIAKIYLAKLFTAPTVAIDAIRLAGFGLFDRNEKTNKVSAGITSFGVLPEGRSLRFFKNTGFRVSEKLFEHCIKRLKENSVDFIRADTRSDNISMNNFYKRAGFKIMYSYRIGILKYKKDTCSYMQALDINEYLKRGKHD